MLRTLFIRFSLASARAKRGGFALLITLILLAFVVVLLVGLATYTRVETAIATNTQQQAQARQNALLALDIALAQLQKYAGLDTTVTATGAAAGGASPHYTGAWARGASDPVWLVSGVETTPDTSRPPERLVGPKSVGENHASAFVTAPVIPLRAFGVPGQAHNDTGASGGTRIGGYAWWVGDQGVKAPVAVPDRTDDIRYPPFDSAELRSRLRQQIGLGAGAADASGAAVFEPRDSNNAPLVANDQVATTSQLAFLKTSLDAPVGWAAVQQNFHTWSPNNFAVLANTKEGGLRQDLSIKPDLLGPAFAAWADSKTYREDPANPNTPSPEPPFDAMAPVRRRYRLQPPQINNGAVFSVAPVLTHVILNFNIRAASPSSTALIVRLRTIVGLWNPYSSAFVPEDLRLEISGLPEVAITDTNGGLSVLRPAEVYGSPLRLSLAWEASEAQPDKRSWLPGRIYYWAYVSNTSDPGGQGNEGKFYNRNISQLNQGYQRSAGNYQPPASNGVTLTFSAPPSTLNVSLWRAKDLSTERALATYTSPRFDGFTVSDNAPSNADDFGFVFRLVESFDTPVDPGSWLATDPRHPALPAQSMRAVPQGPDPAQYVASQTGALATSNPSRLFDRVFPTSSTDGLNYNEDVPLFELPRAPLLSLGQLQHLQLEQSRPFSVGNSWGATALLNGMPCAALFDRFFFSGLADAVAPTAPGRLALPNPLLRLRRKPDGSEPSLDEVRGAAEARSSKFLLQGGAFNLNSTNPAAWRAVLRAIRFTPTGAFTYLDADPTTGTASDDALQSEDSAAAHFFRFSQSAQEVYKAEADYVQSGSPPDSPVVLPTHLFRRGMRRLDAAAVTRLAARIAELVSARQQTSGPYRSLEEFLSPDPNPAFSGQSLLERAIADANINVDESGHPIEFSSQFLTQADLMTALAPVLFPRSDTFVIRTYGEAVNPATNAIEGRAWCEALVQRVPEYFDPTDAADVAPAELTSDLNKHHGRRFKVVSFRWLTRSDI